MEFAGIKRERRFEGDWSGHYLQSTNFPILRVFLGILEKYHLLLANSF